LLVNVGVKTLVGMESSRFTVKGLREEKNHKCMAVVYPFLQKCTNARQR